MWKTKGAKTICEDHRKSNKMIQGNSALEFCENVLSHLTRTTRVVYEGNENVNFTSTFLACIASLDDWPKIPRHSV